jgi:hypothetical protein
MFFAILAARLLPHTIGKRGLQPIELGPHNIQPPVGDQASQMLAHALPHDAGLAEIDPKTFFEQDGRDVD